MCFGCCYKLGNWIYIGIYVFVVTCLEESFHAPSWGWLGIEKSEV